MARKHLAGTLVLAFLVASLPCLQSFGGGGVGIYELGTPDMGMSVAGASARAEDPGTVYFNAAGMTRLDQPQMLSGMYASYVDARLNLNSDTVSVPPGRQDGGDFIGGLTPAMGSYLVLPIGEKFRFGFSLNVPFAGAADYGDYWVGQTFVTEVSLITMDFHPAVAYKVNEWLSVGAGLHVFYSSFDLSLRATPAFGAPEIDVDDADDWSVGGDFSVLIELDEKTRIGAVYFTGTKVELDGDISVPAGVAFDFGADLDLPQAVNVAIYHQLTPQFAILGDVGWTDWSDFGSFSAVVGGGGGMSLNREWDDTWRVGIGFQYQFLEDWLLRGGFSYDSSPVDDDKRLPDIPVDEQYRISAGLQHDISEKLTIGMSYTFIYLGEGEVDGVVLPPTGATTLDGDYSSNTAHVVGITLNLRF